MWESVNDKFWLYVDSNISDRVPSGLIVEGFVLVLGARVTSEDALTECLATLDTCHNHPKAFTLAGGGLYCSKDDIITVCPPEAPSPYVKVDCSLPYGLHTQWHAPLHERPMLQREARITEHHTYCIIGALSVFVETGKQTAVIDEAPNRTPPVLRYLLDMVQSNNPTESNIRTLRQKRHRGHILCHNVPYHWHVRLILHSVDHFSSSLR